MMFHQTFFSKGPESFNSDRLVSGCGQVFDPDIIIDGPIEDQGIGKDDRYMRPKIIPAYRCEIHTIDRDLAIVGGIQPTEKFCQP